MLYLYTSKVNVAAGKIVVVFFMMIYNVYNSMTSFADLDNALNQHAVVCLKGMYA